MAYVAEKPRLSPPASELRRKIAGWGVDLDPKDRPAVPKENYNPGRTGARWDFPERQVETYPRERTPEHKFLTPVFGTSCPPKLLSGMVRRYGYRLSEGRLSHWLLLALADRIDVLENRVIALLSFRPDNPIAEMGLLSELKRHGLRSRWRQRRADVKHLPIDVVMFAGTGVALVGAMYGLRRLITPQRSGFGQRLMRAFL